MKTRIIVIFALAVLVALAAISVAVCAEPAKSSTPAASAGCDVSSGGCGGGCGSSAAPAPAAPDLKLTAAQKTKLAAIDKQYQAETKALDVKFTQKRDLLTKLIDDPKSSDATIKTKMHELADIQADLQLAGVFADRARNKVYTAEQKAVVSKSSGCGCGSGGGGCGG